MLDRAVTALDAAGWQVHVHAIGDRATRSALDAFAAARERNGASGLRHTIAHVQVLHPDDTGRFAALDVLADLQLQWAQRDPYTLDHLRPYLGEERWRRLYPARSLEAAGALLCGGSDWPVDPLLPFKQISGAVLRGAVGGAEPLHPEEAIPLRPRWRCTRATARSNCTRSSGPAGSRPASRPTSRCSTATCWPCRRRRSPGRASS